MRVNRARFPYVSSAQRVKLIHTTIGTIIHTTTMITIIPMHTALPARTLVRVPTFMHRIPVSEDLEKRIHILYFIFPHNYSIHTFSNNCCRCSLSSFDSNPILCIDGDGWQGAEISISTCDGTEVLAATTLSCAYEDYFCVDDFGEQDVVVTVTDDYYSSEVEWTLYSAIGSSLIYGGACDHLTTSENPDSECLTYDSSYEVCSGNDDDDDCPDHDELTESWAWTDNVGDIILLFH